VGHLTRAALPRVLVAVLGAVLVSGCGSTQDEGPTSATTQPTVAATLPPSDGPVTGPVNEPDTTPDPPPDTTPDSGTALASLATLPVKGRASTAGYHRERFGQAWLDADRNGCDTRNDMLTRDLSNPVYKDGTRDCVVLSGDLADPYTATRIRFVQGDGTLVDIDHVVALGNVWVTGGSGWGIRKRAAIANDPLNLLPVDASANRQKGDGDAATWLPSNKPFRCAYVARQVTVKAKYGLWVTAPERGAIARVLSGCPEERLADDSGAPTTVDQNITDPYDRPTDPGGDGPVHYENCDAARAAGAAPVHRGDPGYGPHLDGDGDGSACE